MPRLGLLDLTNVSIPGSRYTPGLEGDADEALDGLVAEISSSVSIGRKLLTISSGGSDLLSVSDWSNPFRPRFIDQKDLEGFFTTSVATQGNLVAVAKTPADYSSSVGGPGSSSIEFFGINRLGSLRSLGSVSTGFLTDGIRFSADGRKIFAANEGSPNGDYSSDPIGSISIVNVNRLNPSASEVTQVELPELTDPGVAKIGSGIRFAGLNGTTDTFAKDAEPEYLSQAGRYLFVTLQENNTVARINLASNRVEAYIGLGWVDYSQVSVDLDDRDGPPADGKDYSPIFNPESGQNVVGLRMADGIAAWQRGRNTYFITANEGDGREYEGYLDERRNKDLDYPGLPDRLKLIVNNAEDGAGENQALVLSSLTADNDPTNDFTFESGSRTSTPVGFGSRSLSLFDGLTGELIWDSWMTDRIRGVEYNTSLQNIAEFAGIYDDTRSDDKGVEPESVAVLEYRGRRYAVGAMERTNAGELDAITEGGLLVVYDVTNVNNVDFVTYQTVSRSPEGLEVIQANQSPTGRTLLGVSSEFNSNSVEFLDFGALLRNGNGAAYLASDFADPTQYTTLSMV